MENSPELKDSAAMFASVLQQEAMKTIPKIDEAIKNIRGCLTENRPVNSLTKDISLFQNALACYESDIKKAQDTCHDYFLDLVGDLSIAKEDIVIIRDAQEKINRFSD